jgi:FixJ family two-component response regulator
MTGPIVFIVSEDAPVRQSVKALVESAGLQVAVFPTLQALLDRQQPESRGCLVFYPRNDTLGDPAQQARLAAACAGRPGILILERGNVPMAVQALKAGITDVVQKPYWDKDLLEPIGKVLAVNALS